MYWVPSRLEQQNISEIIQFRGGQNMILVTGGTGSVGRQIVEKLQQSGNQVRVLTRNPQKVTFSLGVEVVSGDLTIPETLKDALNGIKKVFLVRVPNSDGFPQIAKASGIEHIVFLSSGAIDSKTENTIGRNHLKTEEIIQQSGLKWTFLRPGAFMSNALQWCSSIRTQNVVVAPFGDVGSSPIDPWDIADVATNVLLSFGHNGKIYRLSGPEVLTPIGQVKILSDVLGKSIRFENMAEEIGRETMNRFAPSEVVDAVFQLLKEPTSVLKTVEEITGRPANTFKQWAIDNIESFR